jgi:hypothetical protein
MQWLLRLPMCPNVGARFYFALKPWHNGHRNCGLLIATEGRGFQTRHLERNSAYDVISADTVLILDNFKVVLSIHKLSNVKMSNAKFQLSRVRKWVTRQNHVIWMYIVSMFCKVFYVIKYIQSIFSILGPIPSIKHTLNQLYTTAFLKQQSQSWKHITESQGR